MKKNSSSIEADAQLAAIVENSDDAIIGENLDGIITSWNRGAERIFGYSQEEAIGRPIAILTPPDLSDDMPQIIDIVRGGGAVDHYETTRQGKDGRRFFVALTVSPIRNRAGKVIGASKIARDITRQKQEPAGPA